MKEEQKTKLNLKVGDKIDTYFKDRTFKQVITIVKITEKCFFWTSLGSDCAFKSGINTINELFEKGFYKLSTKQ